MTDESIDTGHELIVDGNAAGGLLQAIFALEMTASPAECANCGNVTEVGALMAFTRAPGIVLRCPACKEVMLRVVETSEAYLLDMRGMAYLRIGKRTG